MISFILIAGGYSLILIGIIMYDYNKDHKNL